MHVDVLCETKPRCNTEKYKKGIESKSHPHGKTHADHNAESHLHGSQHCPKEPRCSWKSKNQNMQLNTCKRNGDKQGETNQIQDFSGWKAPERQW